jgi:hypothetical protein
MEPCPVELSSADADQLYGSHSLDVLRGHQLARELEELSEKMIQEVMVTFEEERVELDFSLESLEELDTLITQHWPEPIEDEDALSAIVANWGAYLTLLIFQNVGGQLRFRRELDHVSVYFERLDWEVFPFHRVRLRFSGHLEHTMSDYYIELVERLTKEAH